MKPINPDPVSIALETIRQQEIKKQVSRDLRNRSLHQTKARTIRWLQLLTLFTLIVLFNIVFKFGLAVFILILAAAVVLLSYNLEQVQQSNSAFDLKGYNTRLLTELRNSVLPNSLPTEKNNSFQSSILRSKLVSGNIQLLDRFKGQTTWKNKTLNYNFSTIKANYGKVTTFEGTVFVINSSRINCKEIIVQKGTADSSPSNWSDADSTSKSDYIVFSKNKEEAKLLINESFLYTLKTLSQNKMSPNARWSQIGNQIVIAIPQKLILVPIKTANDDLSNDYKYLKNFKTQINKCLSIVEKVNTLLENIPAETVEAIKRTKMKKTKVVEVSIPPQQQDFYQHLVL